MSSLHPAKRQVSFASHANVRLHKHISSFTEWESEASYYTSHEFTEIRAELHLQLEMIDDDVFVENDNHCTRGLECRRKDRAKRRNKSRRRARHAVLSAQLRGEDTARIAEEYRKNTADPKREAIVLGSLDARAADEIARHSFEEMEANVKDLSGEKRNVIEIGSPLRTAQSSAAA